MMKISLADDKAKLLNSLVVRSNNLVHGCLKHKIFFLHVPKCGGTAITEAIKSCYRSFDFTNDFRMAHLESRAAFKAAARIMGEPNLSTAIPDNYEVLKFRENILMYYMCMGRMNYISGHFTFSETAYQHFHHKYKFITLLRDPVKRWISAYFYNCYSEWGRAKSLDLKTYLQSDFGKSQGYEYVKFLGGSDLNNDYTSEQAINRAKANLEKFSIVGFLEDQEDFIKRFQTQFGRELNIKVVNRSPKSESDQKSVITKELMEEIKALCQPDIEVYQYAIANLLHK